MLDRLLDAFAAEADTEWDAVDSTTIEAHPQAAGTSHKKGGHEAGGLGQSRGGHISKLHVAADALELPLRIIVSPGHRGDMLFGGDLIAGLTTQAVPADRAYDANHFRLAFAYEGAEAVIPSRPDRPSLPCDVRLLSKRNLVERLINRQKQFRRVATR
ncbi:IS5 family transposase [Acuticoccus yangtzensis]|uniref:IS5 family transposase n=1 Tax=Acuticoccus yangtzensis TaxID=1443441 RepID=UPI000A96E4D0|nr:IS5 family transposase [Acuticoccus yangtzensis]